MNTKLNLSEKNKDLLLMGAKTTGSFTDGYHYIYESLYIDEADSLYAFCEWIENEIGGAGPINIQDLWYAFNHPEEQFSKMLKSIGKSKWIKLNHTANMNNKNTTIDKVAMSEFGIHYHQLGDNEKQWCHDEMVNNPKWLKKDWEDPMWTMGAKWKAGLPIYKTYEI